MQTMTIEGETPEVFLKNFAALANRMGFYAREQLQAAAARAAKPEAEPAKTAEPEAPKPLDGDVLPPERPKRGRPAKAAAAPEAEPVKAAEQSAKALTADDVRVAMRELAARKGVDAVAKLLAEFGAKKASDVPEDRIAEFVELANA